MDFKLILKGAAMGIAEVIPGVSGGTIAFITGIYEQLLATIKAFHPSLWGLFRQEGFSAVWEKINGPFLVTLMIGMVGGLVTGVFGVTWLLETYPVLLWSFFFGLIVASAIYIARQITQWNILNIILLILGGIIAYYITIATPAQGSDALWLVFIAGAIAISALILPGISGSFMLLLMGMYTIVIPHVKAALKLQAESLLVAFVFGLGCLTGLFTVANVLSWTFKNYRNPTLALLTGFMIGSLNKIWPWRVPTQWLNDAGTYIKDATLLQGEEKIITEMNVLPQNYTLGEPYLLGAIALAILGFVAVFAFEKLGKE